MGNLSTFFSILLGTLSYLKRNRVFEEKKKRENNGTEKFYLLNLKGVATNAKEKTVNLQSTSLRT